MPAVFTQRTCYTLQRATFERSIHMESPVLVKSIPPQVVNEQGAYGPFNLKDYIQAGKDNPSVRFQAELMSGEALPKGLICTGDGIITGIPAKNTQGNYEIKITATNEAGTAQTTMVLTIKPSLADTSSTQDYMDQLKAQVWKALEQKLPVPDLTELYNQPISFIEIYYLLERWGILTIWDAFNLEPAGEKKLLTLEGASQHYNVYDRETCLIMGPKDLYSHERTIEDGLMTARAMAREVYNRGWTVELAGFEKLTRAAWVEIQHLVEKYGKPMEVINYHPTPDDMKIYRVQSLDSKFRGGG